MRFSITASMGQEKDYNMDYEKLNEPGEKKSTAGRAEAAGAAAGAAVGKAVGIAASGLVWCWRWVAALWKKGRTSKVLVAGVAALFLAWLLAGSCHENGKEGRNDGASKTIMLPGGAKMEMVWCPPGSFLMGRSDGTEGLEGPWKRNDEMPQHQVFLTKGFWMARTEVTEAQWFSVMGRPDRIPDQWTPSETMPASGVNWEECTEFCLLAGLSLPTEAEWEYACRAGSTGAFAGTGIPDEMAWSRENSGGKPHPVALKHQNAWGLFDMHGNLEEWCADEFRAYQGAEVTDPVGKGEDRPRDYWWGRAMRGGSFIDDSERCRSAARIWEEEYERYRWAGFRPVLRE